MGVWAGASCFVAAAVTSYRLDRGSGRGVFCSDLHRLTLDPLIEVLRHGQQVPVDVLITTALTNGAGRIVVITV